MLSRRKFGACAICAAVGFSATKVEGQTQAAPGAPGLQRSIIAAVPGARRMTFTTATILHKTEFPGDKYVTVIVAAEIDRGAVVPRHTHHGVESAYVLEGEAELFVKDQPARKIKQGDSFQIPPETPHGARNGDKPFKLVITYVVEKDKPLASPAPE